ncbi:MAG: GGDEF domain-containing protein [Bacillota bacterium]
MRARWTGASAGLLLVALLYGLTQLPYGWAVAATLAAAGGWLLAGYIRQMRHRAEHDELTGMQNRRPFERRLAAACRRQPVSLLFMELDNFGQINKQYGHLVGDQALLSVCRLLEQATRQTDLLARWGGDEFVLLLPGTDANSAYRLAERIRALVEQNPFPYEGIQIPLSLSTGVASLDGGGSPADLFRRAEQAHRIAKQRKNAVHLCS